MPKAIFVLGFSGTAHAAIPPAWAEEFASGVMVLGKREYRENLKIEGPAHITRQADISPGFREAVASLEAIEGNVLVLASGDPGFFGPLRLLREVFPTTRIEAEPAPSAVSVAFGRLGQNWEDCIVLNALGPTRARDTMRLLAAHLRSGASKIAVLCSPQLTPAQVASIAAQEALVPLQLDVFADLNSPAETWLTSGLRPGTESEIPDTSDFAVCVLQDEATHHSTGPTAQAGATLWAPAMVHAERKRLRGKYTKPEISEMVLAKLSPWSLPFGATLWDVGAGTGGVGLDALAIRPDLKLISIERDPEMCALIAENAAAQGSRATIVEQDFFEVADSLFPPEAIFVGGGGTRAISKCLELADTHVPIVATSATIQGAVKMCELLGEQVMVQAYRSTPLAGGHRIDPMNPVFISYRTGGKDA